MDGFANHGLYLHLPFCGKRCPYCHFDISTAKVGRSEAADLLIREFRQKGLTGPYDTVFLGGGTPLAADLTPLAGALGPLFEQAAEVTLELNPENLPLIEQYPYLLPTLGVTRLSLGVQSFDPKRLFQLGRGHHPDQARQAASHILDLGCLLNVDLLLCPFDGEESVVDTNLNAVAALRPHHISWYMVENPGHGHWYARHETEAGQAALLPLYAMIQKALLSLGYEQYEISNFSLPGCECRHNLGYWLGGTYDALGPSAAAFNGLTRSTNLPGFPSWKAALLQGHPVTAYAETLDQNRAARESLVLRLRTKWGASKSWLASRFPPPYFQSVTAGLDRLVSNGCLYFENDRWRLPPESYPHADSVLCHLIQ